MKFEKLRRAALAKDFASTEQERQKAAKEFKKIKCKVNKRRLK